MLLVNAAAFRARGDRNTNCIRLPAGPLLPALGLLAAAAQLPTQPERRIPILRASLKCCAAMLVVMSINAQPAAGTRTLSVTDFPVGIDERYFEDYRPAAVYEYGHLEVTENEMVNFARRFDPQPIHTDAGFALAGPFGGMIASGWYTAGIFMRLFADHYLSRVASLASPGVDELRWPTPLRPGDRVRLRTSILTARPSRSKPDRGVVQTRGELINQDERVVLSLMAVNLLSRREPG